MENKIPKINDRSVKMTQALKSASERVIVETKATNTYVVISDGKGGLKKSTVKIYKESCHSYKPRLHLAGVSVLKYFITIYHRQKSAVPFFPLQVFFL